MTKSLARLNRLAERNKIKGIVAFDPYVVEFPYRYRLVVGQNDYPLGGSAQAARFALNHMGEKQP